MIKSGLSLEEGLGCAIAVYGKQFDPATSLRALCSYRDGDLNELDSEIKARLSAAARLIESIKKIDPIQE